MMTSSTETFAQRLRSLQKVAGINSSELARGVGVTATCVHNWREGNTFPGPHNLAALARELGTSEEHLRDGAYDHSDDFPPEPATLSDLIPRRVEQLRAMIAEATGLDPSRVKLSLEIA